MFYTISDVHPLQLYCDVADNGDLVVMDGVNLPFPIARVFVVRAQAGAVRGQHAHKACTQLLICSIGSVEVCYDDGNKTETFLLDRPDIGLLVPPSIWMQQTYLAVGSVLTVLCDRAYEPEDYIRDYDDFMAYRAP